MTDGERERERERERDRDRGEIGEEERKKLKWVGFCGGRGYDKP